MIAGCDSLFGDEDLVLATLMSTGERTIQIPEFGSVGVDLAFEILTVGSGMCTSRIGPTKIDMRGSQVDLTPYDYVFSHRGDCQLSQPIFHHTGVLRFEERGVVSVFDRGRVGPHGDPISIERTITVE